MSPAIPRYHILQAELQIFFWFISLWSTSITYQKLSGKTGLTNLKPLISLDWISSKKVYLHWISRWSRKHALQPFTYCNRVDKYIFIGRWYLEVKTLNSRFFTDLNIRRVNVLKFTISADASQFHISKFISLFS